MAAIDILLGEDYLANNFSTDLAMPNLLNARYVVGCHGGARSSVWRVIVRGDDVYVNCATIGGIEKLSFHQSRNCRKAFTAEYGVPPSLDDRATTKWKRSETPPVGSKIGHAVLEIRIPTDTLSTALAPLTKKVTWISPSAPGTLTVLLMLYTRKSKDLVLETFPEGRMQAYVAMPSGEAFVILSHPTLWVCPDVRVPASHHAAQDYLFSADDPDRTGRPVRLVMFSEPKDGDKMIAWEYGGYQRTPLAIYNVGNMGTLTRNSVIVRS